MTRLFRKWNAQTPHKHRSFGRLDDIQGSGSYFPKSVQKLYLSIYSVHVHTALLQVTAQLGNSWTALYINPSAQNLTGCNFLLLSLMFISLFCSSQNHTTLLPNVAHTLHSSHTQLKLTRNLIPPMVCLKI